MKNLFKIIIAAVALAGCTIEPAPWPTHGHSYDHNSGYVYDYCSPRDYDYDHTEFDCFEAWYVVEVCDPDRVYSRPGCWESWELREFDDCIPTHYCINGSTTDYDF